jgi:hypothetical protein
MLKGIVQTYNVISCSSIFDILALNDHRIFYDFVLAAILSDFLVNSINKKIKNLIKI